MGVWSALRDKWSSTAPTTPKDGEQSPISIRGSPLGERLARRQINFETALTVSAVFACLRLISETIASLPLEMYKVDAKGVRTRDRDHPLSTLLRHRPNRHQTRFEFWQQVILNLAASGNAYIAKGYSGSRLVALTPINSAGVRPELLTTGAMVYHVTLSDNSLKTYQQDEIWHIKLMGSGIVGLSPLSLASQTVGVALDAADKVAVLLSNGAKPTGVLSTTAWPNSEQRKALREELAGLIAGSAPEIPVLGGSMEFKRISLTPADIELLATRRFSIEEIARIFGVPSVLINDTSASTAWGSGIGALSEGYYKFNLRPYLERIECSMVVHLLPQSDWDKYEFEFNADALLRASLKDRVEAYAKQITTGQVSPNEIRQLEGLAPVDGGGQLLVPANLMPVDQVGRVAPVITKNEEVQ